MDLWGCEEACKCPLSSPKLSVKENISAFKSVRNRRRTGPGASRTWVPCVWAIPGCFDMLRHPCQANQAAGHRDRLKTPKAKQVWSGRRNSSQPKSGHQCAAGLVGKAHQWWWRLHRPPLIVAYNPPLSETGCGGNQQLRSWREGRVRGGGGILPDSTTWKNTWFGMCGKFLEDQLKMRCVNSLLVVVHKPVF